MARPNPAREAAVAALRDGATPEDVAAAAGASVKQVQAWARQAGVNGARPKPKPDAETEPPENGTPAEMMRWQAGFLRRQAADARRVGADAVAVRLMGHAAKALEQAAKLEASEAGRRASDPGAVRITLAELQAATKYIAEVLDSQPDGPVCVRCGVVMALERAGVTLADLGLHDVTQLCDDVTPGGEGEGR